MKNFILYKDKTKLFEANIKVDGAKLADTKARLILKFDSGITTLYECDINYSGECKVEVPPIKYADGPGKAILEVIADSTMFEPWTANFSVEQLKKVTVEVRDKEHSQSPQQHITVEVKNNDKKLFIENKLKTLTNKEKIKILKTKKITKKSKKWALKEFKDYSKADIITAAILYNI